MGGLTGGVRWGVIWGLRFIKSLMLMELTELTGGLRYFYKKHVFTRCKYYLYHGYTCCLPSALNTIVLYNNDCGRI